MYFNLVEMSITRTTHRDDLDNATISAVRHLLESKTHTYAQHRN